MATVCQTLKTCGSLTQILRPFRSQQPETATTTKKLMFELYVYSADGKLVAQYETDQFRYEFYGLNAGSYTLGVRGRNENGMKGAETQVSLIIGRKPPNSVQWILVNSGI
jgi:hypothetical protein